MEKKDYYARILPVIGNTFTDKTVAFFGLDFTHQIADCLARGGIKSFVFVGNRKVEQGDAIVYTYGVNSIGNGQVWVLANEFEKRNPFNKESWNIANLSGHNNINEMAQSFRDIYRLDLIVAGGSWQDCKLAYEISKESGIPAIIFMLHKDLTVHSTVMVSHPDMPNLDQAFLSIHEECVLNENNFMNRLSFLRVSDLAMNFVNALLLRDTKYYPPAFEKIFFNQNCNVVLYGKADWPWWVNYVNLSSHLKYLVDYYSQKVWWGIDCHYSALQNKKVMVIGCGTASLLLAELVHYFNHVLMVDYKPFSSFNAVRQLPNTNEIKIGLVKPFLLQKIFTERLGGDNWQEGNFKYGSIWATENHSLAAANLLLKDNDKQSVVKFKQLLEWFSPDVVVIAMGRTHDDNFTACRILREMNIKHVVPAVYPGAVAHRVVVVNGNQGPCYECHNHRLSIDATNVATGDLGHDVAEFREMFYMSPDDPTDPATIAETWPSVHTVLELTLQLGLPDVLRSIWFSQCLAQEQISFVGGVKVSTSLDGEGSYGVKYPGQVVVYSSDDILQQGNEYTCSCCGRKYFTN